MLKFSRRSSMTVSLAVVGLLASMAASAQPGQRYDEAVEGEEGRERHRRGPASILRQMDRVLDLSDEQTAQLTALFESQRAEGEVDRAALRENREALKAELESDNPNSTAIGELMLAGREFREQAHAQRQELREEISAVLTDEQQATWEGFQKGRRSGGKGMRGGRGTRGERGEAGARGRRGSRGL